LGVTLGWRMSSAASDIGSMGWFLRSAVISRAAAR
jgi:hypothetical protein